MENRSHCAGVAVRGRGRRPWCCGAQRPRRASPFGRNPGDAGPSRDHLSCKQFLVHRLHVRSYTVDPSGRKRVVAACPLQNTHRRPRPPICARAVASPWHHQAPPRRAGRGISSPGALRSGRHTVPAPRQPPLPGRSAAPAVTHPCDHRPHRRAPTACAAARRHASTARSMRLLLPKDRVPGRTATSICRSGGRGTSKPPGRLPGRCAKPEQTGRHMAWAMANHRTAKPAGNGLFAARRPDDPMPCERRRYR